jgi:hypothetical protein
MSPDVFIAASRNSFYVGKHHKSGLRPHVHVHQSPPTGSTPPRVFLGSTLMMHVPGVRSTHCLGHLRGKAYKPSCITQGPRTSGLAPWGKSFPVLLFDQVLPLSLFLSPGLCCHIDVASSPCFIKGRVRVLSQGEPLFYFFPFLPGGTQTLSLILLRLPPASHGSYRLQRLGTELHLPPTSTAYYKSVQITRAMRTRCMVLLSEGPNQYKSLCTPISTIVRGPARNPRNLLAEDYRTPTVGAPGRGHLPVTTFFVGLRRPTTTTMTPAAVAPPTTTKAKIT